MRVGGKKVGGARSVEGAEGGNHDATSNHDVVTASRTADLRPTEEDATAGSAPAAARLPPALDARGRRRRPRQSEALQGGKAPSGCEAR